VSTRILHFAFGPVQDFVAQARRTRDLWAGSYLISYLAGCAMKAVTVHRTNVGDRRARVVLPSVDRDALFLALTNGSKVPSSPDDLAASVGSLPNRFKARVPDDFNPGCCAEAVQGKWEAIAATVKAIWQARAKERAGVLFSDDVWNRQIPAAWEFTWAFAGDVFSNGAVQIYYHNQGTGNYEKWGPLTHPIV
jgi:CRISPR-associated protein Cmr2